MSDFRFNVEDRDSGTFDLPVGAETGTVVATWDSVPTKVKVSVQTADGSVAWATVDGDLRDDGFDFSLSAAPTVAGSKLHWLCDF